MIPNYPEHRYELDKPHVLEFKNDKENISVTILRMDVSDQIILKGLLSVELLALAIKTDAFHLGGETNLPTWETEKEIDLVLKLDEQIAKSFDSTDQLFADLFDEHSILQKANSWYALEAMQFAQIPGDPDSTTSFGIRTQWAE